MNLKRGQRRFWALSALVHRYLYRDPVALVYLEAVERLGAQLRWKQEQQNARKDRREACGGFGS